MTTEKKQEITQALQSFVIDEKRMSQNELAEKLSIGVNYISAMINGSDKVQNTLIKDCYWEDVADMIGVSVRKVYWKTLPTTQLHRIMGVLEGVRSFSSTSVLIGETGSGKSYVVRLFEKTYPRETFVITVGQSDSLSDVIDKLLEATHVVVDSGSKSKKIRAIVQAMQKIKREGGHPVIIMDEAEYLRQPALCSVKELYDNLHNICGIVMIGTEQLINNLDRLRRKNKQGIPQLYRRIKFGIQRIESIDRTFSVFLQDIKDRKLVKFLQRHCDNYGELHDVLVPAMREADRMGQPLNEDLVRLIFNMPDNQ